MIVIEPSQYMLSVITTKYLEWMLLLQNRDYGAMKKTLNRPVTSLGY